MIKNINTPPIKVAITDDHHMVIEGLERVLQAADGIELTGIYTRATELLNGLKQQQPDVLLLDVQLPDKMGHEIAKDIVAKYPNMRILVLSSIESHYYIHDMIKQGCRGYLLKNTADKHLLISAIKSVHAGEIFLDPSVKDELMMDMLQGKKMKDQNLPKLTEREKQVLKLIVKEYSNPEVAEKLCISLRTVENHRYNLLQKLNVKNTVGLVKIGMQMGLLD